MKVEIDGQNINTEQAFHDALASALKFPEYYGKNLDALWDTLSTDVERPIHLVWMNSKASQESMPEAFCRVVDVLRRVEQQDVSWNLDDKFQFELK